VIEVAAVEDVDLAQGCGDGGITLVEVSLAEVADGSGERASRRRSDGKGDPDGEQGHDQDGCDGDHVHAKSMTRGCHSIADAGTCPRL
jgi:hypothetical protein